MPSRWVHPKYMVSRNDVWSPRSTVFRHFLPHGSHILLSSSHYKKKPRLRIRNSLVFVPQTNIGTCYHPSHRRTFSKCLSHKKPASVCPYKFRSRRPLDPQCLTMIWAIRVVEEASQNLDILTLESLATLKRPPILLECVLTVSAACPAQSNSLNFALWIQHKILNRVSQCHLGARPSNCTFDTSVPTPHFWDDSSHQCGKVDFIFLSLCFQDDILFAHNLVQSPRWLLFESLPFFICCSFHIRNFHTLRHRNNFMHQVVVTHRNEPSLPCDLHDFLVESIPNAFSWIHEPLRCMHALSFVNFVGTLDFVVGHPRLVRTLLRSHFYKA